MRPVLRFLSVLSLALGAASAAQAQAPPGPTPAPALSPDERIKTLEQLLAETRAELAKMKASSTSAETNAKLEELSRRIDILAQEIQNLKMGEAAPTLEAGAAAGEKSVERYGIGPAAAKIYSTKKGVSIGGYGEILYSNFAAKDQSGAPSHSQDVITDLRAVVYIGYKFDDHFVLNSEIEYENAVVASDKGGEAEVEFAYIDYMHAPMFNARAGLILIPSGLINQLHEPTAFLGARRPDVDEVIIPTTWREIGSGFYGTAGPVSYQFYGVNGLNAAGYTADGGIHEGSQEGSEALAQSWAFTGRVDYTVTPGLLVGASIFSGDSGQGQYTSSGQKISGLTTLVEGHADWRWRGLWLRGIYAHTTIQQADLINQLNNFEGDESVGSTQWGWYVQGGYDVLSLVAGSKMNLIPFVRYEQYDTQAQVPVGYARNPENDVTALTLGAIYQPIPQLIFKADWQQKHNAAQTGVNVWNVLLGYVF
ncbi:MAG TPA: TonB-dependent receptor [Thermoanaerobaculia bacterium]|jgi:uncharacterized small protein (DUF1192 family)